jgi:hypothetical protein
MNLAQNHSTLYENLADLQEQSLILIASFAGMLGYACFLWASWASLPDTFNMKPLLAPE